MQELENTHTLLHTFINAHGEERVNEDIRRESEHHGLQV